MLVIIRDPSLIITGDDPSGCPSMCTSLDRVAASFATLSANTSNG
jgi:hypothetical protein